MWLSQCPLHPIPFCLTILSPEQASGLWLLDLSFYLCDGYFTFHHLPTLQGSLPITVSPVSSHQSGSSRNPLHPTWDTRRWFSLSQVSRMAALRSKRAASCSSFSWRISSVRRASSRSCSAFSSRSQACRVGTGLVKHGQGREGRRGWGQGKSHERWV
jgi:hypothetical protein